MVIFLVILNVHLAVMKIDFIFLRWTFAFDMPPWSFSEFSSLTRLKDEGECAGREIRLGKVRWPCHVQWPVVACTVVHVSSVHEWMIGSNC